MTKEDLGQSFQKNIKQEEISTSAATKTYSKTRKYIDEFIDRSEE